MLAGIILRSAFLGLIDSLCNHSRRLPSIALSKGSSDPTSATFSYRSAIAQTRERNCFRRSISFIVGQLSRPRATTGQSESHGGCKTRSEELVRSGRGRQPPPNHLPVRLHSRYRCLSRAFRKLYMYVTCTVTCEEHGTQGCPDGAGAS